MGPLFLRKLDVAAAQNNMRESESVPTHPRPTVVALWPKHKDLTLRGGFRV